MRGAPLLTGLLRDLQGAPLTLAFRRREMSLSRREMRTLHLLLAPYRLLDRRWVVWHKEPWLLCLAPKGVAAPVVMIDLMALLRGSDK